MVLVDPNGILAVATDDPHGSRWSAHQLRTCLDRGPVAINAIVYGEIAVACETIGSVDELLPPHLFDYRAHEHDRSRGGERRTILPDVLIGAHAQVERMPLLTRDRRRYRQAFPGLDLISP